VTCDGGFSDVRGSIYKTGIVSPFRAFDVPLNIYGTMISESREGNFPFSPPPPYIGTILRLQIRRAFLDSAKNLIRFLFTHKNRRLWSFPFLSFPSPTERRMLSLDEFLH